MAFRVAPNLARITNLEELYDAYREDSAFEHLRTESIRLVPGFGSSRPSVLLVGEAPGATENTRLRPFCGPSGRVLASLMDIAGLYLEPSPPELGLAGTVHPNSFVTNVVKYRPPGNRTPTIAEVLASQPYLREEWRLLGRPRIIVAVGSVAKSAVGTSAQFAVSLSTCVARPCLAANGETWVWAMFHPAYGLRREKFRPTMEQHWERFGDWMKKEGLL